MTPRRAHQGISRDVRLPLPHNYGTDPLPLSHRCITIHQELGFCRDASSLYPAFYVNAEGTDLTPYGMAYEEGDAAMTDPLDMGLMERAMRTTTRPGNMLMWWRGSHAHAWVTGRRKWFDSRGATCMCCIVLMT